MIGVVCSELGTAENLTLQEIPTPEISAGDVLIKVAAAAVNFPDNLIIQGRYQVRPPLPFVPGFEVAGVVHAVGDGVEGMQVGDRVMALTKGGWGGYAEFALARSSATQHVPAGMNAATAAGFYSSYGTSCHALIQRGRLEPGETLVVLGAAGGVGLATIELGKALGARVIGVAGGDRKLEAARAAGADNVIDYREQDLRRSVLELTEGRGADVCLDVVGGDAFDAMSRAMARDGRLLVVGFASGRIPHLPVNLLLLKGYQAIGVYWNDFVGVEPELARLNSVRLSAFWADGLIHPLIAKTYPLQETTAALAAVAGREVIGKLVVTMPTAW